MGRSKETRALIAVIGITLFVFVTACSLKQGNKPEEVQKTDTLAGKQMSDSAREAAMIDTHTYVLTDSTIQLKNSNYRKPGGRVVNMMIVGVDSRLGDGTMHADANHLVRFFIDSGCIEIISIPRDTYADAGFDDTTTFNKLTNVRANKGRTEYLNAVKEITGVDKIDYWVEFGFSQAIGLLEMIGYKDNATSTLRVLRSRQAFATGDFQRSYNQGQFIRQAMLKNVNRSTTIIGDLALRASLMLVETNLTFNESTDILEQLQANGFDGDPSRVWVRVEPPVVSRFQAYEFDSSNIQALNHKIDERIRKLGLDSIPINSDTYENRLNKIVAKAATDSARSPGSVIHVLRRPFEQRAWLQITDKSKRLYYRNRMCNMLADAYTRRKNTAGAERVRAYVEMEDAVSAGK